MKSPMLFFLGLLQFHKLIDSTDGFGFVSLPAESGLLL